jgi:hypothetical protein
MTRRLLQLSVRDTSDSPAGMAISNIRLHILDDTRALSFVPTMALFDSTIAMHDTIPRWIYSLRFVKVFCISPPHTRIRNPTIPPHFNPIVTNNYSQRRTIRISAWTKWTPNKDLGATTFSTCSTLSPRFCPPDSLCTWNLRCT